MKYTIITDSCCNLFPKDLNSSMIDFHVVPLSLVVGDEEFIDNESLDTKVLLEKMKACKIHAKTACPSPEAFAQIMRKGENIIVITLSSKLSATYASAMSAAEMVKKEYPDKKLVVIDTLSASTGQDQIMLKLKELIESNKYEFDEISVKIAQICSKIKVRFLLQDLSNLIKSGRLGKIIGTILSTARIKLICGDSGAGEIKKYGMSLSTKKGFAHMANYLAELAKAGFVETSAPTVVISHVNNEEGALLIKNLIETKFGFKNIKITLMRGTSTLYAADKGVVVSYQSV